MNVAPIQPLPPLATLVPGDAPTASFSQTLGALLDGASGSIAAADGLAAGLVAHRSSVADAAIARAKADALLEIAAAAASRVSGAVTALLQTQV